jgi:hypothetical protein
VTVTAIRVLVSAFAFSIVAAPAAAQTAAPRVEIFAGYSLFPADGDDFPRQTSHGVQGSATFNLTRAFGIVGDAGVQWSTADDLGPNFPGQVAKTRVTELLAGPRWVRRGTRADVFGHGLFGWAQGDAGENFAGFSDSALAFGGGGGVDLHVTPRAALRAQFDYIGSFADIVEHNTRLGIGVVLRLGSQ